jgi:uncharacterized protein (DUF1697 family)
MGGAGWHRDMQKQVALFRGINVGRAKRLAMADLRAVLEELGYRDVRTLLNSGNVVFTIPPKHKEDAAARIQTAVATKLGVSASVLTVSAGDFDTVVAENPLAKVATDPARFLVAFVRDPSVLAKFAPFIKQTPLPDVLAVGSQAAYLWCAEGILESKLLAAVHRLLREDVTTRNWATVLKLQALLRA